ncbi:MAG: AraC family transcriptional regulator [Verrucomicrobiota bacterium]|jgi:AraC-like DNA-binding protein
MKIKPAAKPGAAPEFFSAQVREARRFYLDLHPPRTSPLTVVCGGCERCTPDYAIRRNTFPFLSIEFVAQGKGVLRVRGKEHLLHAGKVFCYGPGVSYSMAADPRQPMLKYFVDFAGTEARRLMRVARLSPGTVLEVFALNPAQDAFEDLILSGLRGTRHTPRICAAILELLVLKIAESSARLAEIEPQAFATYRRCREHIQRHFQQLSTLRDISQQCRVNASHLCRLFRRFDHQSPYVCLRRLKMNQAAEQLHQPDVLVKEVAARSGFRDPFSFSRSFKSVFGVSPQAFRQLRSTKKPPRNQDS